MSKEMMSCPMCWGEGSLLGEDGSYECPYCEGLGRVPAKTYYEDQESWIEDNGCPACKGRGSDLYTGNDCEECEGKGFYALEGKEK